MDLRQSQEYAKYLEKIGWKVEKTDSLNIFIRRLPFFGSIIKIQRPEKINLKEIDEIAKKHKALFVKIEPGDRKDAEEAKTQNFKENNSPLLCSKTIQIDLIPSEEKILAQMKKDARYEIRKAEKEPLSLIELDDLILFRKTWRKLAKRERWVPPIQHLTSLKEAFNSNVIFIVAKNKETDKILGGVTLVLSDKTAYYYYAFSSNAGKKLGVPYFLVWEAMKMAKKKGCEVFDFEGIYDERFPIESWKGFTHFKKNFGGEEIEFPGPIIKVYNPILKFLSRFL
ncbi:MAG: peptidoglycan bridge formation glycyltransferase FemA/FemB family protein [bacterium]|nr:peptidoglycan bridge formation glycyltransferase FemA/FemB family protein [bacterium]